MRFKPSLVTIR